MTRFITILLLFLLPGFLSGQLLPPQPISFQHLNSSHGLSNNNVSAITTDQQGFLWVGTNSGLNVYDGHSISRFTTSNTPQMISDNIGSLLCDSKNRIWVGTEKGILLVDGQRKFQRLLLSDTIKEYGRPLIFETQSHGVVILHNKYHFYYDENKRLWKQLPLINFKIGLSDGIIISPDKLLICDEYMGVIIYDYKQLKATYIPIGEVVTACRYNDSLLVAATYDGVISVINIKTKTIRETYNLEDNTVLNPVKMRRMADGRLLITTRYDGVLILDPNTRKCKIMKHELQNPNSVPGNRTQYIFCEQNGNVFFTTTSYGLSSFNVFGNPVKTVKVFKNSSEDFFDGPVNMITRDKEGIFWICTTDRLIRWDATNNRSDFYYYAYSRPNAVGYKSLEIYAVCIDNGNHVWVGTSGGGIGMLNKAKGRFDIYSMLYQNQDSAMKSNFIRQMAKDSAGKIWAVSNMGILQIDPVTHAIRAFNNHPLLKQLAEKRIYTVYIDRKQNIWFGGGNIGAFRWNRRKNTLKQFSPENGFPSWQCNSFLQTHNGDIYAATPEGIAIIRNDSVIKVFDKSNGLRFQRCQDLLEDEDGNIWIANDERMIAYNPQKQSFRYFDNKSGFSEFGFRTRAAFKDKNGQLYWGSERGINYFNPKKLLESRTQLNPIISRVDIGDSSLFISSQDTIHLPASSNNLAFHFSSVNVLGNRHILYRYRLVGATDKWSEVMDQYEVNYNGLPPGLFHFQLKASSDGINWVNAPYDVSIRIIPPFWKTWWFIASIVSLLALGLFIWYRYQKQRLKEEKILTYFATSLYGQNTVEDIFWDIAKNCISQLKFEDCVIYQYDPLRKMLVQRAAYGPKNPGQHEIVNVLEIPIGKGIVGAVAASGEPIIVKNTDKDARYIVDDRARKSELAVPLNVDNRLFGIIDSEHSRKNFYTRWHIRLLEKITAICSHKISTYLSVEQVRSNIARDLHDEIGSSLTSINVMSKIALSKGNGNAAVREYLDRIRQSTTLSMENMSDIVWAINPRNDKLEALMSRMNEFASHLCDALDIALDFKLSVDLENISLDLVGRRNLFLIFKEAVNNAVKYSGCSRMQVNFTKNEHRLTMEINDNGNGFDSAIIPSGNGLRNMTVRAIECEGTLNCISAPGKGTRVIVDIPIPQFGGILNE